MPTTIHIIEEHNEAFYVWWKAMETGRIGRGNVLLHFDDHSDFRYPALHHSIYSLKDSEGPGLAHFTRKDLHIDSFIVPAIFAGIIDDFYWIRQDVAKTTTQAMGVRTYNNEGKYFLPAHADTPEAQPFRYIKTGPGGFAEAALPPGRPVLLDIDLDYFSCCENPVISNEIVLEITRQEYEEFLASPYHYLHFITSHAEVKTWNGSYFYVLNGARERYPSRREVTEQEILQRIKQLVNDLAARDILPGAITVCRSRHSGYTPRHQWEFIEDQLLSALSCLYPADIVHTGSLLDRAPSVARLATAISK